MLIKVFGAAVQGIGATLITIEVNSSRGCMFYLVGLPDSAVKESHQRIISALQVNGYKIPTSNLIVNMAPADIRKEGSAYDLPLAIGLLGANGTISSEKFSRYLLMGELSLDGSIQPIKGALPIAIKAREDGFDGLIIPQQNAREAAVVNQLKVYGVSNIKEVIEFFNNERELEPTIVNTREEFYAQQSNFEFDFADVKGQENVKRALEVALQVQVKYSAYNRRLALINSHLPAFKVKTVCGVGTVEISRLHSFLVAPTHIPRYVRTFLLCGHTGECYNHFHIKFLCIYALLLKIHTYAEILKQS